MAQQTETHPVDETSTAPEVWRERAVRKALVVALAVGVLPLFFCLLEAIHTPRYWPIALSAVSVYGCLVLLVPQRVSHHLRAWGLLLAGYAGAGLLLARGGLTGSGWAYLAALPAAAIALVGVRPGVGAALISLLVYGWLSVGQALPGLGQRSSWGSSVVPRWLQIGAEGAAFVLLLVLGAVIVALLVREQTRTTERVRRVGAALEEAQRRLLTAQEEERRVLAWELHDGPVQDLIALDYQLAACRDQALSCDLALTQRLDEARREVVRIMKAVRAACSELRFDMLHVMGLGPAMTRHAYDLMQRTGVAVYLDAPELGPKLAAPLGVALLRVFQEALNNAVEHAKAQEVWARFALDGGEYELRVWDEGPGFVVPEQVRKLALQGHFGLTTMRERVEALGGHLEVRSAPGQGTEVRAWGTEWQALRASGRTV